MRAFWSTAFGLTLVSLAGPVGAWAPAGDVPAALAREAVESAMQQATLQPVARGTVLLRRTQEALPPPTQAELDAKLQRMAANAAQNAANAVRDEAMAKIGTHQTATDSYLRQLAGQNNALLEETKQALASAETRLTSFAQTQAAQTTAVLQANTAAQQAQLEAQKTALLAMRTENQNLQSQLANLQGQTHQAIQKLSAQQTASTADTREYARLQALTAQLTAQREALLAARGAAQAVEARVSEATSRQIASLQDETTRTTQSLASRQQQDVANTREYAALQAKAAKQEALLAALAQGQTLREDVAGLKGTTTQALASLTARQQQDAASMREYAVLQAKAAKQEALLAALAQGQTLREDVAGLKGTTTQALASLTARQQQDVASTREYAALQAKAAKQEALLAALSQDQTLKEQVAGFKGETAATLQGLRAEQRLAAANTQAQIQSVQQATALRMAALEQLTASNRQLAAAQTGAVAAQLKGYADAQLAQLAANTSSTLQKIAATSRQDVESLRQQTSGHLVALWQAAEQRAAVLAEEKANAVAQNVARLEQETDRKRLTPAQVKDLAGQAIAEAQPELRALALQTLKDGQDYIRTVARDTLQNPDPAVSEALANAARDVITKDNKIVFALRKAVADGLPGAPSVHVNVAAASPTVIRLGNGWGAQPQVALAAPVLATVPAATPPAGGDILKEIAALQAQTVGLLEKMQSRSTSDASLQGVVAELQGQKAALARVQAQVAARSAVQKAQIAQVPVVSATSTVAAVATPAITGAVLAPLTDSETTVIDSARLRIAALQPPRVVNMAQNGSGTLADAFLAALAPAAGDAVAPQTAAAVSQTAAVMASAGVPTWSPKEPKGGFSLLPGRPRGGYMDIRSYKVVLHEDNKSLEELMNNILSRAVPFTGPWQVKWKISKENIDLMAEKFSLDVETTFDDFVAYVAQYMVNERGVKLSFSLFDNERIIVISD